MNKKILTVAHVIALLVASSDSYSTAAEQRTAYGRGALTSKLATGEAYRKKSWRLVHNKVDSYFNCSASNCKKDLNLAVDCAEREANQPNCMKAAEGVVTNVINNGGMTNFESDENKAFLTAFEHDRNALGKLQTFFLNRRLAGNLASKNGELTLAKGKAKDQQSRENALEKYKENKKFLNLFLNEGAHNIHSPGFTNLYAPDGHTTDQSHGHPSVSKLQGMHDSTAPVERTDMEPHVPVAMEQHHHEIPAPAVNEAPSMVADPIPTQHSMPSHMVRSHSFSGASSPAMTHNRAMSMSGAMLPAALHDSHGSHNDDTVSRTSSTSSHASLPSVHQAEEQAASAAIPVMPSNSRRVKLQGESMDNILEDSRHLRGQSSEDKSTESMDNILESSINMRNHQEVASTHSHGGSAALAGLPPVAEARSNNVAPVGHAAAIPPAPPPPPPPPASAPPPPPPPSHMAKKPAVSGNAAPAVAPANSREAMLAEIRARRKDNDEVSVSSSAPTVSTSTSAAASHVPDHVPEPEVHVEGINSKGDAIKFLNDAVATYNTNPSQAFAEKVKAVASTSYGKFALRINPALDEKIKNIISFLNGNSSSQSIPSSEAKAPMPAEAAPPGRDALLAGIRGGVQLKKVGSSSVTLSLDNVLNQAYNELTNTKGKDMMAEVKVGIMKRRWAKNEEAKNLDLLEYVKKNNSLFGKLSDADKRKVDQEITTLNEKKNNDRNGEW